MSLSLNSLLNYFPQIKEFYDVSSKAYSLIGTAVKTGATVIDCDVYFPTEKEILANSSPEVQALIDSVGTAGFDPITIDSEFNLNEDIAAILSGVSDSFKTQTDELGINPNFTDSEIRNLTDEFGKPCPPSFSEEDIQRAEQVEQLKESIKKQMEEDSEFMEFIDNCKRKDALPEALKQIEEFTLDEIKQVASDCFDTGIPNISKPLSDDVFNSFTDNVNIIDQDEALGDQQPFSLSPEATETIMKVLGEQSDCFSTMNEYVERIKELSNEYTEHVIKKPEVEKEYVYTKAYYTMLKGIDDGIRSKDVLGTINASTTINLFDDSVEDYSKEIKRDSETISSKIDSTIKYKIGSLSISKIDQPERSDGDYFEPYFKVAKTFRQKKFKDGTATQEEYEAVDKKAKDEVLADLDSNIRRIRTRSRSEGAKIYRTLASLSLVNVGGINDYYNEVRGIIAPYLEEAEERANLAEERFFSFEKKTEDFVNGIKDLGEEMSRVASELGCEPPPDRAVDSLEDDPNVPDDFRGDNDGTKPTPFDPDYWKKFAKLATTVGLLPIPQFFGSNDFTVDVGNPTNPKIKVPGGSIAFDDDGIPRFLFYPIGLIIPTPLSVDGIYRIPLPMIWQYLFMFNVDSPINALLNSLSEYESDISVFKNMSKSISSTDSLDQVWANFSRGNLEAVLSIMGIASLDPNVFVAPIIAKLTQFIKSEFEDEFLDMAAKWELESNDFNPNKYITEIDQLVANKRNVIQRYIDENINNELKAIISIVEEFIATIDISGKLANVQSYIQNFQAIISAIRELLSLINSCVTTNFGTQAGTKLDGPDNVLAKARAFSSQDYDPRGKLGVPQLALPYLKLSDYLFLNKANITQSLLLELSESFDIFKMFPKLKLLTNKISGSITRFYHKMIKRELWKSGFDPRVLFELEVPEVLLSSLALATFDFPNLTFVFFLGISGAIPYPFMLLINHSNTTVPGVVDKRTMEFLITLDFADPIKIIKKDFGSRTVPLKTQIETVLNQSLGLYYDSTLPVPINLCNINGFQFPYADIAKSIAPFLNPKFLLEALSDTFGGANYPNPDIICKMINAKSEKERMDLALNEVRLNGSIIPPKLSKLSVLSRYGIPDYSGELKINGLKQQFDVNQFPTADDVLGLSGIRKTENLFSDLGTAVKAKIDLLPSLSAKAPFIQDDLPSWERLRLSNIPFTLFLGQFLVAAKKGAKLPIAEVNPALEM